MKIDRGAPAGYVAVQGAVRAYVGSGVGNGDEQGPTVTAYLRVQGIVYVLGAGRIYGDEFQVGEVPALAGFQGLALGQQALYFLLAVAVPLCGQPVLRHAVVVFDTRSVVIAHHGQHLGLGFAVADGVAQDGAAHIIAFFYTVACVGGYEQPAVQLLQVRFHEHRFALAHTAPGEIAQWAVHQLFDIGDGFVVFGGANADLYPIIGKDLEHFIRWDEYLAAIVEHRETIAALGTLDNGFSALFFGLHLGFEAFELRQGVLIEHEGSYLWLCADKPAIVAEIGGPVSEISPAGKISGAFYPLALTCP